MTQKSKGKRGGRRRRDEKEEEEEAGTEFRSVFIGGSILALTPALDDIYEQQIT